MNIMFCQKNGRAVLRGIFCFLYKYLKLLRIFRPNIILYTHMPIKNVNIFFYPLKKLLLIRLKIPGKKYE
jgi:hypothetical protein